MENDFINETEEVFNNTETTENLVVNTNISATEAIQNTYYVVSSVTFLIFVVFMYRYLKAVFKRRN